jgi:predicted nucleic acid-binding protein
MIVIVDTNVLFAALRSKREASHHILKLILTEELEIAISAQTYFEYMMFSHGKRI